MSFDDRVLAFVREAARVENWSPQMDALESAAKEEPAFVVAVARATREGDPPHFISLRSHAILALALAPGVEQALGAIEVAYGEPRGVWERIRPGRPLRTVSAVLAQAQPHDVIVEIAERLETRADRLEVLAMLLHESLLRGMPVADVAPFVRVARELRGGGHALGLLPLHRLPIEAEVPRRSWFPRGSSGGWSLPEIESEGAGRDALERRRRGWRTNETTTDREAIEIRACALSMLEESNGQAEARVFEVAPALPEDVPAMLWSFGLEALRPMTGDLRVGTASARHVFQVLFGVAANGGAYDSGLEGAWGRLHAWRSFRALCGAQEESSPEDVVRTAEACRWHSFTAESPYFANVAWDAGIACLRPDASVAVLAITDTD